MKISQESIFFSAIRSFFTAAFAVIGILAGSIPLFLLLSALLRVPSNDIPPSNAPIVLPDANERRESLDAKTPLILQLNIQGVIGSKTLNSDLIRKKLQESQEGILSEERIRGILLIINSPGGAVNDSDCIYRAIKNYKEQYKVPVYAYIDGLCASGGMYIASSADKIYSSEISLVGSVGVMMQFINLSQAMEKIGVESKTLVRGKSKDAMNPLRPWRLEEDKSYQALMEFFYNRFVDIVTSSRPNVDRKKLIEEYGAKLFSSVEAEKIGLIDAFGYERNHALEKLAEAAGISEQGYQVIELQTKHWWLSEMLDARSPIFTGKLTHELQPPFELNKFANCFLYLYAP